MWLIEAVFIGRISAAALGGVGFALQIILLTCTVLLTFVMGAIIIINRHLGSKDHREANHILGQTIMAGFLMSIPIGLVWYFGAPFLFRIIHEQDIISLTNSYVSGTDAGVQYLQFIAFFAPVILTNFIAVGLIRGVGATKRSMAINLTINAVNIVLSPILIYGLFGAPRLEVLGAAIALCASHMLGFAMTLCYLRRKSSCLFLSFHELTTPRWESVKTLFKMGLPTTVEQLVWSVGQLVVTSYVALIGITALAIHMIFLRIQGVLSMFYLGFGLAAMTQMGKHIGANDHHIAEHTGQVTQRVVFGFVLTILVILMVFSSPILHMFIRKGDMVIENYGFRLLFLVFALVQVPKAMNTVISGSLRGAGDIQWIMWVNVVTVILIELGVNWIGAFVLHLGLLGIWMFQGFDEVSKSVINYRRFRGGKWKLIRI